VKHQQEKENVVTESTGGNHVIGQRMQTRNREKGGKDQRQKKTEKEEKTQKSTHNKNRVVRTQKKKG